MAEAYPLFDRHGLTIFRRRFIIAFSVGAIRLEEPGLHYIGEYGRILVGLPLRNLKGTVSQLPVINLKAPPFKYALL